MDPGISYTTLGVSDLERSIRFYVDVLGLAPLPSPPSVASAMEREVVERHK